MSIQNVIREYRDDSQKRTEEVNRLSCEAVQASHSYVTFLEDFILKMSLGVETPTDDVALKSEVDTLRKGNESLEAENKSLQSKVAELAEQNVTLKDERDDLCVRMELYELKRARRRERKEKKRAASVQIVEPVAKRLRKRD